MTGQSKTLYELVNFSDHITFYAPNPETAALAAWFLSTAYGATSITPKDTENDPPIASFGLDPVEWFKRKTGKTIEEWMEDLDNLKALSDAWESFRYGDRAEYEELIAISKDPAEFDRIWEDRKRGSMNNIGKAAASHRKRVQEKIRAKEEAQPTVG